MMKRIISIVLLACLLCGMLAGCKAKKSANSATDVEIVYWETGYGRGWLDALAKAFNERQDVYHVTVVASAENRLGEVERGNATGDLYLGAGNTLNAWAVEYLHPLDGCDSCDSLWPVCPLPQKKNFPCKTGQKYHRHLHPAPTVQGFPHLRRFLRYPQ